MESKDLVREWFEKWEQGDYLHLPLAEDFRHTSPFGVVDGRVAYLELVEANEDKFLGYRFEVHDEIHGRGRSCVRYTAIQGEFSLDVSEWYYIRDGLIEKIDSYYHIGEIQDERKLAEPRMP